MEASAHAVSSGFPPLALSSSPSSVLVVERWFHFHFRFEVECQLGVLVLILEYTTWQLGVPIRE
jgi:hypothetical protein